MNKTFVAVLRGGPSEEYEVSLKTGQAVIGGLSSDKYEVKDILIDKDGVWHLRGVPVRPIKALEQVDVVFIALHGKYGEDGKVQKLLDTHNIPYVGTDSLASAVAMNKALARTVLKNAPFKHPEHRIFEKNTISRKDVFDVFRHFPQPSVVKPVNEGSSVGVSLVRSFDELLYALTYAFSFSDKIIVEQYIKGREATVAVAEGFRGEDLYVFPPVEIVTTKNAFFDYDEKYAGYAKEVCPAVFERSVADELLNSAKFAHHTLGLRDYSRSDFIVAKDGVYFLEVNTLPGLTEESLVPKAVNAVGATLPQFLDHLLYRAKGR